MNKTVNKCLVSFGLVLHIGGVHAGFDKTINIVIWFVGLVMFNLGMFEIIDKIHKLKEKK